MRAFANGAIVFPQGVVQPEPVITPRQVQRAVNSFCEGFSGDGWSLTGIVKASAGEFEVSIATEWSDEDGRLLTEKEINTRYYTFVDAFVGFMFATFHRMIEANRVQYLPPHLQFQSDPVQQEE